MISWMRCLAMLLAGLCSFAAASELRTIEKWDGVNDFSWVPRELKKAPTFKSAKPRYTLWALGDGKKSVMTMVWDESGGTGTGYDTLYLDRNFSGDLTLDSQKIASKPNGKLLYFEAGPIKEADGDRTFSFGINYDKVSGRFDWQGHMYCDVPNAAEPNKPVRISPGILPGNLEIHWSNDLKTAPVYHFGGQAIPTANAKFPGESLGVWEAGRTAEVWTVVALFGDSKENQLRFFASGFPGGHPEIMLRVAGKAGSEDIAFAGGCACGGGFGKHLVIPSRVPPGKYKLVVRMDRDAGIGGPAEFTWPVEVANPYYGQTMQDPAFTALKAAFPNAAIAAFHRDNSLQKNAENWPAEPEKQIVPMRVADTHLTSAHREGDERNRNNGASNFLSLGDYILYKEPLRALLQFDLSGIPKETKILGAQLRLTIANTQYCKTSANSKLTAFAMKREWNESDAEGGGGACWLGPKFTKDPKTAVLWGAPGADDPNTDRFPGACAMLDFGEFPLKLDPASKDPNAAREARRVVALDLTEIVKRWRSGETPNDGIMLKLSGGACDVCSSEFAEPMFRPTLVLAYEGPAPTAMLTLAPEEDLELARAKSSREKKPLLVKFYSPTCAVCRKVQSTTFAEQGLKTLLAEKFSFVNLNIDDHAQLAQALGAEAVPAMVVLAADGKTKLNVLESAQLQDSKSLLTALDRVLKPK